MATEDDSLKFAQERIKKLERIGVQQDRRITSLQRKSDEQDRRIASLQSQVQSLSTSISRLR